MKIRIADTVQAGIAANGCLERRLATRRHVGLEIEDLKAGITLGKVEGRDVIVELTPRHQSLGLKQRTHAVEHIRIGADAIFDPAAGIPHFVLEA